LKDSSYKNGKMLNLEPNVCCDARFGAKRFNCNKMRSNVFGTAQFGAFSNGAGQVNYTHR
ncbi:hypothetical protein CCACVL1_24851, partial [Corchorus capsularis]